MSFFTERYMDAFAVVRYHKKGKCSKSVFADGGHRVGLVPVYSVMDGGLPGDIAKEICLECEKVFKKRVFYPIAQPATLSH